MNEKVIYLDYAATTPVDPQVAEKMSEYLTTDGIFGNPSSMHATGRAARAGDPGPGSCVASGTHGG